MRGVVPGLAALCLFLDPRADGRATVEDRLREFGGRCDALWRARAERAGLAYPPARVRFLALKRERRLEVFGAGVDGPWRFLADFPLRAASGGPGPKLREGDRQVPEGLYDIPSLNPNSLFHVSLRVGYPSAEARPSSSSLWTSGPARPIPRSGPAGWPSATASCGSSPPSFDAESGPRRTRVL
jgi:hypothetical protein